MGELKTGGEQMSRGELVFRWLTVVAIVLAGVAIGLALALYW